MAQFAGGSCEVFCEIDFIGDFFQPRGAFGGFTIEQNRERTAWIFQSHGEVFAYGLCLEDGGFLEFTADTKAGDLAFGFTDER